MMHVESRNVRHLVRHRVCTRPDFCDPVGEVAMVLTLDQLRPNPDNLRLSRNPKYDEIKASICARGLDTVPKITRDPNGDKAYIFSDGGNTRYQILTELWRETGEERFYHLHCFFKPWPGRLQCVIGHLAENAVRGKMSFIEKALGIQKARQICEEQKQATLSLRELSSVLSAQGLPVHYSAISRMNDTVKYLYPWMPGLLVSGLGTHQICILLALRRDAANAWHLYEKSMNVHPARTFNDVFAACCRKFDAPELWSPEMFRDELIGELLRALPHPALNYDRWLLELHPGERHRRAVLGDVSLMPDPAPAVPIHEDPVVPPGHRQRGQTGSLPSSICALLDTQRQEAKPPGAEVDTLLVMNTVQSRPEYLTGGTEVPGELSARAARASAGLAVETVAQSVLSEGSLADLTVSGGAPSHPVRNMAANSITQLQQMTFGLACELAASVGDDVHLQPDITHVRAAGYWLLPLTEPCAVGQLLLALATPTEAAYPLLLARLLTGTPAPAGIPVLNDRQIVTLFQLIGVLRRLRALQRSLPVKDEVNDSEDVRG